MPDACAPMVLVADDEPDIRTMLALCLERLGLRALPAASGEEAVQLYFRHRAEVGLVLLDVHMPGLGGLGALAVLRDLAPELPVVLVTGSADHPGGQDVRRSGASRVLAKPFRLSDLGVAVRAYLPARAA
jgi:CheY-like chemotaxis protein